MIIQVQQHNADKFRELLDQMFEMRARVFRDSLGWPVEVVNGKEKDRFDDEWPLYLICALADGATAVGSIRLLPTTGPTLMAECFSDTVPDISKMSAPTIWEATRLCVEPRLSPDDARAVSAELIVGMGETCLEWGIESIIGNFDSLMKRFYKSIGCEVEIHGSTDRYGYLVYLGTFHVTRESVDQVRRKVGIAVSAEMR